jgi:uncharacterized protein (DUF2147 family)
MKYSVLFVTFLFSIFLTLAHVSAQSTQEKAPAKSAVVVKKTTPPASADKAPNKQVAPSNQKKPVNPVNPVKPSVVPPKNLPTTTVKDITGYWLTANKSNIIQFYKEGDVYHGKIVWVRQNKDKNGKPLTDVNNPDKSKRKNPIVGTRMVSNLRYNTKTKTYEGGKAYLPQMGKTFDCKAKLIKNNDAMEVTAMAGLSLVSKTLTWTRTTGVPSK